MLVFNRTLAGDENVMRSSTSPGINPDWLAPSTGTNANSPYLITDSSVKALHQEVIDRQGAPTSSPMTTAENVFLPSRSVSAPGMSTGTKIGLGVGILGALTAGYFIFRKKRS